MKRKNFFWIVIVILIIVVFLVVPTVGSVKNGIKDDYYVFNDIGEINSLNLNFTKEFDISKDKYLKDLIPLNSRIGEVLFQKKKYLFYSYEFSTNLDAQQYYKNITGRTENRTSSFHGSGNYYFSNSVIVYKNNKVYYIHGGYYKDYIEFVKYINDAFSDSIKQ